MADNELDIKIKAVGGDAAAGEVRKVAPAIDALTAATNRHTQAVRNQAAEEAAAAAKWASSPFNPANKLPAKTQELALNQRLIAQEQQLAGLNSSKLAGLVGGLAGGALTSGINALFALLMKSFADADKASEEAGKKPSKPASSKPRM